MIVVDSSVLVDFLKGASSPAAESLDRLARHGAQILIPAVCAVEVRKGARDESEWHVLGEYLETQALLPLDPEMRVYDAAARIYFDCRRRGLTVRGTIDCLVAQQALDLDAVLLHDDDDFERIAQVRPLKAWRGD